MTLNEAYKQLLKSLCGIYSEKEAANITELVIEHITDKKKIDRIVNKSLVLNTQQQQSLEDFTIQLLHYKPVQYVLHEAWFSGSKFYVDQNVLIPRPETEELVDWIIKDSYRSIAGDQNIKILDIGTGSGCIAISLKKKLGTAEIFALDISGAALEIAKKNAQFYNLSIHFYKIDILKTDELDSFIKFDIIVSNPPYITQSESININENVLMYEPHLALFVQVDPLLFYKSICNFATSHLKAGGKAFLEINETFGQQIEKLLQLNGFSSIEIKKDLQGKDRMIKAVYQL